MTTPRTALVTGCSSGIGRAAALQLARRGLRVMATARDPASLQDLVAVAKNDGLALAATECDVTNDESVSAAVAAARAAFGSVHVLVNNAGYGEMGPLEGVSLARARRQLDVNLFGPARLVQLITPDMRAAGWGRIINVSSVLGITVMPFGGWYCASKFALEAISDVLRLELKPFGIETVSILPGPVHTQFSTNVHIANLPPALHKPYRKYLEFLERRQGGPRKYEVTAEAVAALIVKAATVRRPRTRYYATFPAHASRWLRRIATDRVRDGLTRRWYGLDARFAAGKEVT